MTIKLVQATTITAALYILMGLSVAQKASVGKMIKPPEALVAIKQALVQR